MRICLLRFFLVIGLIFTLSGAFSQAPVISYTPATNVYTVNTGITPLTPTNTGGAVLAGALTTFASPGGAPYGIAYDPTTGDIITNDFGGSKVLRYSPSGVLLNTYVTSISGPKDIVVDNSGNIYEANPGGTDVVKITPAGVTTTITGSPTAMNTPDGMAMDNSGNIFVADQATNKVYKIAPGATTATVYASGFTNAYGVTVDNAGNVFVSESSPTANIIKIAVGTLTQSVFISKAAGSFTDLRNLDIDANDNLYVANYGANSIQKITPAGVITTVVTGLVNPRATCMDVFGNLYIANSGGNDVEELSPANYSINIPLPAGMSFNTVTGVISGTPTVTSLPTTYTIVGHNASGSGYTTVTITVNPTGPTGIGDFNCGPGVVNLSASGGLPAGGTYNWYAAASGGSILSTGANYNPVIAATTTFYVDYTQGGVFCAARTAVVGTISANPIISTAPTTGANFSYSFTGGITTDISGSNNGTLHGAPVTTTDRYSASGNAYSFASASSQYISTATSFALPGPQTFSISVWFKTSTAGGYLAGYGNAQTGNSATVDRVVYMGTNGQLYFGVAPLGVKKTINTVATYNDNAWHHVVATFSTANGSNMYVDGSLAASDPTMNAAFTFITTGYWRVAYDVLTGYTNAPATAYFNGSLDDIAVANTELTGAQIDVLYGAGSGTFCAGNALTLTANTVAASAYSWVGPAGSGFISGLQNPTVPAANAIAGTYVLTITGAAGCTSTINVAAPGNAITYTWSGAAGSTNPTVAGNWDHLPLFNSTANLVIPTGLAKYPLLTANESVYSLSIASGASLSLGGFTLSVGCDIVNNASTGGTGIIYGGFAASQVTWNGSVAAQSYTGTNTLNTFSLGSMTVNNSAAGTVTINGGPIDIYSTLTMTQGNLAVAASPAALTLKSTATLSASVAAIPAGSAITGTINVERNITGGAGYRSYRLISSPVYVATVAPNNVYSINYLQASAYLTGSAGGGFDKTGNPTLYLYREDKTPSNASFTSGNFWGISAINNAIAYNYYLNGTATNYNIPVGNGVMFFFRGNRASAALAAETTTTYVPVAVTLSASGTLNQGQVTVHDWYTPASANLGYTGVGPGTNFAVRGFNLVGNPYASSIDWEQFNTTTPATGIYGNNVSTTIYELNPATNNYDTYQKGGTFTNHGTRTIASGQGFYVLAANNTSPQLTFNETAKSATQNTGLNLFMAARADIAFINNSSANEHLRLQMALDSINTDDMYIGFNSGAASQYVNEEDAPYKAGNGKVSLASLSSDNVPLAINKMPLPQLKQSQTIPLFVTARAYGIYKLNMTELEGIPQLYEVWLMDGFMKDSLDMRHNTTYAFNITADTSSYGSKRFQLVIRQNPALGVHLLAFTAAKATNGAQVAWKTENEENYTNFTVERSSDGGMTFEALGGFASSAAGAYSLLDKDPPVAEDEYRLKLVDLNGSITYSKVVTLMYSGLSNTVEKNNIGIYPNPASSVINVSINQNIPVSQKGSLTSNSPGFQAVNSPSSLASTSAAGTLSYGIKIINNTGVVIKTATFSQASWQDNISSLLPGTYVIQVVNNVDKSLVGKTKFVKL